MVQLMADLRMNGRGMDSASRRWWRLVVRSRARGWVLDVALGAVAAYVAVILTVEVYGGLPTPAQWAALVLAGVHGAAVAFRRVAPRTVVAVQVITAVGYVAVGLPVFLLGPGMLVTLYTVGSRLPRRTALTLLGVVEAGLVVLSVPGSTGPATWLLYAAILFGAWFLGDVTRQWRDAATAHALRATELEQARTELARHAVTAERVRIARELHDVVAHSMSVIAMHAGSGRLAAERDPAAARRALEVVERSSRDALAEMRRLVTVLRDTDDDGPALNPAPGLQDVHQLVAEVAAAGVTVEVHTEGDLASVPDGVSLATYRIVQEALTNVVRHASPTHARVSVTIGDGEVMVEVTDDGATGPVARAGAPMSGGHGTIGMRERAALYGGELTAGPRPEGGWRIAAHLPYAVVDE
ncbi:MAG TPA: sensor histidine kinase [Jiangellaceae bacterium]|nr:sensor histidine kinase [Jiangellaceae bacterium]